MSHSPPQGQSTHDTTDEPAYTPPQSLSSEHRATLQSTPLVKKSAGTDAFTSTHVYRDSRLLDMVHEAQNHIVGPMPLKEFVDLFLPMSPSRSTRGGSKTTGSMKTKFDRELLKMELATRESDIYPHFIKAVKVACPNFTPVNTSEQPFPSFMDIIIKPDISFFPKSCKNHKDITMVEMMAEFKIGDGDDAFASPTEEGFQHNLEKLTGQGQDTLGQITAYATAHKCSQFRTHLFSLLIFKKHARILFWDCSGVVVTERFLLREDYFLEFFTRFNHATKEQRGHDPTVQTLSKKERLSAMEVFPGDVNLVKLSVGSQEYVVQRSLWMGTGSPFGRSTRTFTAHPISGSMVDPTAVFLKDTWRVVSREREDLIYKKLQEKNVPFTAKLMVADDVLDHQTKVQEIAKERDWVVNVPKDLRKLQHFRLVLKEIGSELLTFTSTRELVSVIYDALQAHKAAYEDARVLHRDISVGNILIGPNRRGLLVDWDFSKDVDDNTASASERTGTWQFTAARLLRSVAGETRPVPNLADDLESFLHVLTWIVFRYTSTSYSPAGLRDYMQSAFDNYYEEEGVFAGGQHKISYLKSLEHLRSLPKSYHRRLIAYLSKAVAVRYEEKEEDLFAEDGSENEKFIEDHRNKLAFLSSSKGFLKAFERALSESDWPTNDAAKENPITKAKHTISRKRTSEVLGGGQRTEDTPGPSVSKRLRLSGIGKIVKKRL
ncbi:hypothetical protein Clacol_004176 [Clathrus columnatus]|uniref:Fungal-type protein kinase domain-containing protein n=1 Tax=Clathrus columnatus TaxID=1419009 RepID=A0AAV5A8F6_9AGAM|nr:hypothetical protein Clacol_004176 [Clathrus columnatus]